MLTSSMYLRSSVCSMGRGRAFPSGSCRYDYNCNRVAMSGRKNTCSSINYFGSHAQFGGLYYKWALESVDMLWRIEEEEKAKGGFEVGDVVDIAQLLFTKNRDYLTKFNDSQLVRFEHLAGKVIVIYFVPLHPDCFGIEELTKSLMDTYNDLKFMNCFEVVLVVVDDVTSFDKEFGELCPDPSLQGEFEDLFSQMPWVAIPFSDITSRKVLKRKFGYLHKLCEPKEVLIDSTGMILHTFPQALFQIYGSVAYPFTNERIALLKSEDETVTREPSLQALLGTSERDYVISNRGDKGERVADVPWLVSRVTELLPGGGTSLLSFYSKCYNRYQSSFLLAYAEDGSLVRRTICPVFGETGFPFFLDGVKIEAFDIGYSNFCWGYWDTLYQGLLRYSYDQINFPSGELLFSVYSY